METTKRNVLRTVHDDLENTDDTRCKVKRNNLILGNLLGLVSHVTEALQTHVNTDYGDIMRMTFLETEV